MRWARRALWWAEDLVLEGTVFLAYGKPGYLVRRRRWDPAETDVDLTGRVVVVTGANTGIGRATAEALAQRGATTVLACRDAARGEEARAALAALAPAPDRVVLELLDVSSADSVRSFARRFVSRFDRLDVLVHNAGTMTPEREESSEGIELTFATNVLGGWLLTRELLPALSAADPGRIIHVTSGGMYTQRLDAADPLWEDKPYRGIVAYAQSKRAQAVLSEMWAERLADRGVTSHAMHPGWVRTPLVQSRLPRFNRLLGGILRAPHQGADTIVWLAVAPGPTSRTGGLFFDRARRRAHVLPFTRERPDAAAALWERCERLAEELLA